MRLLDWLASRGIMASDHRAAIRSDSQSLGFAVDLCHALQRELVTSANVRLSLLDVGARTAAGSNLIAQVFHPASYSRVKLDVTALDIEGGGADDARARYPDVEYVVADVMEVRTRYDVVTCSHTLEHVAEPGPVLEHMRTIARRLVMIAAPYEERLDPAIPNPSKHLYSFGPAFFEAHPPRRLDVYPSPHWSSGDCFLAVYEPA